MTALPTQTQAAEAHIMTLLLADARLPSGAHAQSGQLEPAVIAGMSVADVPAYMADRLDTIGRTDAAVVRLAQQAVTGAELTDLEWALHARTPSPAMREAAQQLGRGLLRIALALRPDSEALLRLKSAVPQPSRPVALGAVGAAFGLDGDALVRLACYDDAQTITAAALKLLPVDPAQATGWMLAVAPVIDDVVVRSRGTATIEDIPALSAPGIESWAEHHHQRTRRLFRA